MMKLGNRKIRRIIFISSILLFTIIAYCTQQYILMSQQKNDMDLEKELSTEEFLEDYDRMWMELEENYVFFPILESEGIDVSQIKEDMRERISQNVQDLSTYVAHLNYLFGQFKNFAHLSVLSPDGYNAYTHSIEEGYISPQKAAILLDTKTRKIYNEMQGNLAVFENRTYPDVEITYDDQKKAVYFKVSSFDDSLRERDKDIFKEYLKSLEGFQVDHIIFDITDNGGGNTLYWMDNIVKPFGGNYNWKSWIYLRETSLTRQYYFDDWDFHPVSEMPENHVQPDFVQQLGLTHFTLNEMEISGTSELPDNILNAKRWVLIDEGVYSAADSFADFCKSTGWATLVGKSTRGDGPGFQNMVIRLQNTGILIYFAVGCTETVNGELNTMVGTSPDYYTGRYETVRQTINRLIQ